MSSDTSSINTGQKMTTGRTGKDVNKGRARFLLPGVGTVKTVNDRVTDPPLTMELSGINGNELLYANFAGQGLWKWDGTTWTQINVGNPVSMVQGS
jgi:hypothetical protein